MPITVTHGVDPLLSARIAAIGSAAPIAEEMDREAEQSRRLDEQQAEQRRQFDQKFDYRLEVDALADQFRRQQAGQAAYQFEVGQESNALNRQVQYGLGQQQLDMRAQEAAAQQEAAMFGQQQQTDRTQIAQLGQIARQQQQQKFEAAMADRKAFEENALRMTPRQQQQYRERWSQKYSMDWTAPEQAMEAEDTAYRQQREHQVKNLFKSALNDGAYNVGDEELSYMIEHLTPPEILQESDRRKSLELKRGALQQQAEREAAKPAAEIERVRAKYETEQELKAPQMRAAYEMKVKQAEAAIHKRYSDLQAQAAKAASNPGDASNEFVGTTVNPEDLPQGVKRKLWQQAMRENPKPPLPPGI